MGRVEDLRDFYLISLVGSLYKLLDKVLDNRLKRLVRRVISNSQHICGGQTNLGYSPYRK